jgi:hypothetical protein
MCVRAARRRHPPLISASIAVVAALLVFGLWYPGALRHLAGGRDLFLLVTSVDVVLGPC